MLSKKDKKSEKVLLTDKDRAERTREKKASAATNDSNMVAELKNRNMAMNNPPGKLK